MPSCYVPQNNTKKVKYSYGRWTVGLVLDWTHLTTLAALGAGAEPSPFFVDGLPRFLSETTFTTTILLPCASSFGGLPLPLFSMISVMIYCLQIDPIYTWSSAVESIRNDFIWFNIDYFIGVLFHQIGSSNYQSIPDDYRRADLSSSKTFACNTTVLA